MRHRLHRLTLMVLLMVSLISLSPTISHRGTESTEIIIVDLSKTLPGNPYQTEYERMLYPTVRIKTLFSTGTGVAIDDYILTAAHVVGNESTVTVELFITENTKDTKIEAIVVITDTRKDLALLKLNPSHPLNPRLYTTRLAPADYQPYIFTPVYSVGCSLGYPPRPSYGIITVIDKDHWEVSSPILPGNSGGPVFDSKTYEVIGIAVWVHTYKNQIITTMAGIVPVQDIYTFLEQVK